MIPATSQLLPDPRQFKWCRRNSNVVTPWISCAPSKDSISVRSGIPIVHPPLPTVPTLVARALGSPPIHRGGLADLSLTPPFSALVLPHVHHDTRWLLLSLFLGWQCTEISAHTQTGSHGLFSNDRRGWQDWPPKGRGRSTLAEAITSLGA